MNAHAPIAATRAYFTLARLSPVQQRILLALRELRASPCAPAHAAAIVEVVYRDCADGGPDDAEASVRVAIFNMRRRLAGGPVEIGSRCAAGYWLEGAALGGVA